MGRRVFPGLTALLALSAVEGSAVGKTTLARGDLSPAKSFLVNSGNDRYAIAEGVEAIGLEELVTTLSTL